MLDKRKLPESRYLDPATATEFTTDPITRERLPVNDGKDVPGWEYQNVTEVGGRVRRFAVRYVGGE